jgi:CMP-N-acetylneuraminic acid synthetase
MSSNARLVSSKGVLVTNLATSMLAVIPAREFDEHMPGKNALPIRDTNLLVHKIRQLKKLFPPRDVRVSSESQEYLRLAAQEGVMADLRPLEFADQAASFGDFVHYVASSLECDHILWASPTSPLVDEKDFELAIDLYLKVLNQGYDSLITVNKLKRFLLDENGPLNFRFDTRERDSIKLPVLYEFVNGIVIAPRHSMIKWRYNWGQMPFKLQLPPQKIVDICNEAEYDFAKFLAANPGASDLP